MLKKISHVVPVIFTMALSFVSLPALADHGFQGEVKDAWLTGKIETVLILNTKLNSFTIDTDVHSGHVTLAGNVSSEIDKSLAEELARGVEGVTEVDNKLVVSGEPGPIDRAQEGISNAGNNLARWVDDATTTAQVKSRLLANSETEGLAIHVDTQDDVVTLSGEVRSDEEKALAEAIASNSGDVRSVNNRLMVVNN